MMGVSNPIYVTSSRSCDVIVAQVFCGVGLGISISNVRADLGIPPQMLHFLTQSVTFLELRFLWIEMD